MAVATKADEINHHVRSEVVAILECHAADAYHRIGILAIDMEDRNRQPLGKVGGEAAGIGIARVGGEADEIVDDDMDRAADHVTPQVGEVQGLSLIHISEPTRPY